MFDKIDISYLASFITIQIWQFEINEKLALPNFYKLLYVLIISLKKLAISK